MAASYPTSVKTFTTKSNGGTIDASHPNDIQDEVTAIETDLLTAFPGGGADGGQMKFPATQNPSTDANTLDDYEEGTWTPTIAFGGASTGVVYAVQTGAYVKIGQLVFISLRLTLTSNGSATGAALIGGLPFTCVASYYGSIFSPFYQGMSSVTGGVLGYVNPGTTTITTSTPGATAVTGLADTNWPDGCDAILVGVYRATA